MLEFDAEELMRDVVLQAVIKESPRFKVRKWLALRLVWLASVVLGCGGFEILEDE